MSRRGSTRTALSKIRRVNLPAGVTDLFVMSHGWNNDADAARELYREFFENFAAVARAERSAGTEIRHPGRDLAFEKVR